MKKVLVSDFSQVLLFPKDRSYRGGLNRLYDQVLDRRESFSDYYHLNESLLSELEKLDIEKHVFTTGKVQDAPEIANRVNQVFKSVFNVPMIGYGKTDRRAYTTLCEKIGVESNQVMFIDDMESNVVAAKEAGLHAAVYEDNNQILKLIAKWLQ